VSDVRVSFALLVGADFVREAELPEPIVLRADLADDGVDGAIVVEVEGREVVDERYWDRLDATIARLVEGLEAARTEERVTVELPDTRLEVTLERQGDQVLVDYQERRFTAPLLPLTEELRRCGERLVRLLEDAFGTLPEHYEELRNGLR
jgi:hypothetical protein